MRLAAERFGILFGIDALTAAVFSLVCGLSDGSVPAFNIVLWLPLLVGVGDGTRR